MDSDNKHLIFQKEELTNIRRKVPHGGSLKRSNLREHAHSLLTDLADAKKQVVKQEGANEGEYIFKFHFEGGLLDADSVGAFGIELISQENKEVCIVFANEEALCQFTHNLKQLGVAGGTVSKKQLLEALNNISGLTPEDRKSWLIKNYGFPDEDSFVLDVELWPLGVGSRSDERKELLGKFREWLQKNNIAFKDSLNGDELVMFRLVTNITQANLLLNHIDVRTIDLPPRSGVLPQILDSNLDNIDVNNGDLPEDAPKVCILDSGINTNHPLLKNFIAESAVYTDDADVSDKAGHGTRVASIALYGDLENCARTEQWTPACRLYNAKVLDDKCAFNEELMESVLIRAVSDFAELGCRVFNVSFGNSNAPYTNMHIGNLAYTLDMLAREYKVLFIISTGNFLNENNTLKKSWKKEYPDYLLQEPASIIDPAPAINGITVGGLVQHEATTQSLVRPDDIDHIPVAKTNQPSPFTRRGPTINGAIKPELVHYGGNFSLHIRRDDHLNRVQNSPGLVVANPEFIGQKLLLTDLGTSFAAPYITHLAARILANYPDLSINAVRALLVNHACIPDECFRTFSPDSAESINKSQSPCINVVGYGMVDEENLFRSDEHAVSLIAQDSLGNDKSEFYEVPIPDEFFNGSRRFREITVSLSYMPAVKRTRIGYRATKIFFKLVRRESLSEVQKFFNNATKAEIKKTLDEFQPQHRFISSDLRSKGTLQCSSWSFTTAPRKKDKLFVVVTRQDQYGWGDKISAPKEDYALVVTLKDKESQDHNLYALVSNKLELKNKERIKATIPAS